MKKNFSDQIVYDIVKTSSQKIKKKSTEKLTRKNLFFFIDKYLAQLDIATTSRITYKRGLYQFHEWIKKEEYDEKSPPFSKETIIAYKTHLDAKSLSTFTRSLYLVCVRQFFSWCESILLYPNITMGIRHVKCKTKTHCKDSLLPNQAKQLLDSIAKEKLHDLRDRCLITLLLYTGLRLIEASQILIKDIEFKESETLVWIRGKGREGKDAFVMLMPEVLQRIKEYFKKRFENEKFSENLHLFVGHNNHFYNFSFNESKNNLTTDSLSRIIRNRLIKAKLKTKRLSAHSLRHTFGVFAIQGGSSLYEVQLAMRHSSPATTQVYLGDIEMIKRKEACPEKKVSEWLKNIK